MTEQLEHIFPKRFIDLRKSTGLSRSAFAERNGLTEKTIENWENGHCLPRFSEIVRISIKNKFDLNYLAGIKNEIVIFRESDGINAELETLNSENRIIAGKIIHALANVNDEIDDKNFDL